jgi:hypothetical protein
MANTSGNAYALTVFCPIRNDPPASVPAGMEGQTCADLIRYQLQQLRLNDESPMARVPNTYLSRLWVLNDVPFQGRPAILEHLKSNYLIFSSNFHGGLDDYLRGMWRELQAEILAILQYCVGFPKHPTGETFIEYIKKCQVKTTFFFNGSSDEPLEVQLKSLYLKQELSKFAFENQGRSPADLQAAFRAFLARTQPDNLARPTWKAGAYHLDRAVKE